MLLGALCVLTLAVVASALYRMSLYQDAFGYTVLRVFVDGFELWLGLVVVFLLVAGVRLSGWWVPRAVLVSAAVFALGFAAMNPDAWVAGRNIDRFDAGASLDTAYLSTLSADATPGHRRAAARRGGLLRDDRLVGHARSRPTTGWRGTSAAAAPPTARDQLAAAGAAPTSTPCSPWSPTTTAADRRHGDRAPVRTGAACTWYPLVGCHDGYQRGSASRRRSPARGTSATGIPPADA